MAVRSMLDRRPFPRSAVFDEPLQNRNSVLLTSTTSRRYTPVYLISLVRFALLALTMSVFVFALIHSHVILFGCFFRLQLTR